MRCKTALLALALVCAPLFIAESPAREGHRSNRVQPVYSAAAINPVIINRTGKNMTRLLESPSPAASHYVDQSDINHTWKSLRTFDIDRTARKPLKVYVETHPNQTALFKHSYVDYVQEGLDAWSEALDGRLHYEFTNNPRAAQIRVNWVAGFRIPEQAGETEFTIGDAAVKIQTVNMPDNVIKGNIMHELGHALGIADHSAHNSDIMVACRTWSSYNDYKHYNAQLSHTDVLAIRRLYGLTWRKGEDLYLAVSREAQPAQVASTRPATRPAQRTVERIQIANQSAIRIGPIYAPTYD